MFFLFSFLIQTNAFAHPHDDLMNPKECETVVSYLLQRKKEALDRREYTINVRELDLKTSEKRIMQKMKKTEAMREELRSMMRQMDQEQLKEIDRLGTIIEKMRAKQAAGILESIKDDAITVAIIRQLPDSKAGAIMAAMNKETAAKLYTLMAQHPNQK